MFYTICGQQNRTPYPAKAIFAFSENDIWIAVDGDQIARIENGVQTNIICLPSNVSMSINKIWGSNSNDLYIVGSSGNIAHYGGPSVGWKKINSGTTTNINDAWGFFENGMSTVYCPVSSIFNPPQDLKILKIIGNKVDSISWRMDRIVYSCWTNNKNFLYVCGEGVFVYKFGTWTEISLPLGGKNSLRGNDTNDIFIEGDNGFIAHYNGSTWQTYNNNYLKGYSRLSFKGDIVVIAGNYQGKAIVEIGRRN
jgi:hypothetical protein